MQIVPGPQWITYAVSLAVAALVLTIRYRRSKKPRRLRLETLWIVPALYALLLAAMIWEYPPVRLLTWVWLALALAVGAALGWRRGMLMRIAIDPETHQLNHQASPAAFLFIVLLLVARQGLRYEGAALGLNILEVTGILASFALGLFAATRVEMFLRARRLLLAARATTASPSC